MPKRVWKWRDGALVQIEGPPETARQIEERWGGMETHKIVWRDDGTYYAQPNQLKAPTVIIPQRHRSAG